MNKFSMVKKMKKIMKSSICTLIILTLIFSAIITTANNPIGTQLKHTSYNVDETTYNGDDHQHYIPITVYVDDDYSQLTPGWQKIRFDKIQDAIDVIGENGKVQVYAGIYYENIIIDKKISLISKNMENTIIDADGKLDVITITSDKVKIKGFTIRNSGDQFFDVGIEIQSSKNIIDNNIIIDNFHGIYIHNFKNENTFSNNHIKNNSYYGVYVKSNSNNNKSINNVFEANLDGICASGGTSHNIIKQNIFKLNDRYSIGFGGQCYYNEIFDNTFDNNTFGVELFKKPSYNNIYQNVFNGNMKAIQIYESCQNTINDNTFNGNEYGIWIHELSNYNKIFHNNFYSSQINHVNDKCSNIYDDGYPRGGNYWDDYTGRDINGDGIGDTPYSIDGGNNLDNYPLIEPYE